MYFRMSLRMLSIVRPSTERISSPKRNGGHAGVSAGIGSRIVVGCEGTTVRRSSMNCALTGMKVSVGMKAG